MRCDIVKSREDCKICCWQQEEMYIPSPPSASIYVGTHFRSHEMGTNVSNEIISFRTVLRLVNFVPDLFLRYFCLKLLNNDSFEKLIKLIKWKVNQYHCTTFSKLKCFFGHYVMIKMSIQVFKIHSQAIRYCCIPCTHVIPKGEHDQSSSWKVQ